MSKRYWRRTPVSLAVMTLFGIMVCASIALVSSKPTSAATVTPGVCRAVMIFDRSGSVGASGISTMRAQVRRLFEPTGIYDTKVELAFWSFSSSGSGDFGYNSPGYGYVSSVGPINTGFSTRLNQLVSGGATNYEQGFGYDNNVRNARLGTIPDRADIIVFMTDGLPNVPNPPIFGGDGNALAVSVARRAVQHYQDAGKIVIGGLVGSNVNAQTLARVINGDGANRKNLFMISGNYSDLSRKLKEQIGTLCDGLMPDACPFNAALTIDDPLCVSNEYSVRPNATVSPAAASPGESARYEYTITRDSGLPPDLAWHSIGVRVDSGVDIRSMTSNANGYFDSNATNLERLKSEVLAKLGGRASVMDDTPSGTWERATIAVDNTTIPDSARAGEKYCRILAVAQPTNGSSPRYRYSTAACVNIGFKPSIQVSGGDIIAGRSFVASAAPAARESIIHTSQTTLSGKLYGSFGEYGLQASGPISGMASLSGLNGGVTMPDSDSLIHRLSFANTPTMGMFDTGHAQHKPDVLTNILNNYNRALAPRVSGAVGLSSSMQGLYVASGDIHLDKYRLVAGQTIVLYAPGGSVTIGGDITSTTDGLRSVGDIPQMVIIADKILIQSGVRQVNSWLIANGTSGMVDTCADAPDQLVVTSCHQQLVVNGPIMTRHLLLKRTGGDTASDGSSAEQFNLRADAYLWAYNTMRNDRRIMTTYTTELAPRF